MSLNLSQNPVWINLLIFSVAALGVWIAGTRLSELVEEISERTGIGKAFAGLVLLATVTSLPEIATTLTAGLIGNATLLRSNIFGGIAMQTAVLALVDFVGVRGALTFFSPRPVLLLQGVLLVVMISFTTLMATVHEPVELLGVGVGTFILVLLYVSFLYNSYRYGRSSPWKIESQDSEPESVDGRREDPGKAREFTRRKLYGTFAMSAAAVAVCGWAVAQTADALAHQTGIGSSLVGAILVAISTSLPEVSTCLSAVRLRRHSMAISNIFGSNAFMLALLFPGDIVFDGILLRDVDPSTLFLLPLGVLVTCTYLWGLLERKDRTVARVGVDSAIVLVLYLAGIVGMYFLVPS